MSKPKFLLAFVSWGSFFILSWLIILGVLELSNKIGMFDTLFFFIGLFSSIPDKD